MNEQTQLNENQESKGLGDTIAKVTHAVGLDKVAETVAKAVGEGNTIFIGIADLTATSGFTV